MEDAVRDPCEDGVVLSPLVDVSDLPLTTVMELGESVLGNALRRLKAEMQDDSDIVAGHSVSIT